MRVRVRVRVRVHVSHAHCTVQVVKPQFQVRVLDVTQARRDSVMRWKNEMSLVPKEDPLLQQLHQRPKVVGPTAADVPLWPWE